MDWLSFIIGMFVGAALLALGFGLGVWRDMRQH